jgi:hypothetical protein
MIFLPEPGQALGAHRKWLITMLNKCGARHSRLFAKDRKINRMKSMPTSFPQSYPQAARLR